MRTTKEQFEALELIGRRGKGPEAIRECFPGLDVMSLVQGGFVEIRRIEHEPQAAGHPSPRSISYCVLTHRGAEAVGIDPSTLHAA
jgi:hypothetical protein